MKASDILSEPVFSDGNRFIIKDLGPDKCTESPFRTKGGIILFCTGGSCRLFIDAEAYAVAPGCECIILPQTAILFTECSSDLNFKMSYFSDDMFSQASRKMSPDFFNHIHHTPVYRHRNNTEDKTIAYFSLLKLTYGDKLNRYRTIIATNILRSFLLDVYDKVQKYEKDNIKGISAGRAEAIYKEFINLLHEHGTEHHDVAFYAGELCITSRYLAAVTSSVANESPKQTIATFLIQEIKILLTFSELTLSQIADRLHFPDQSHFGRFFKNATGLSPMSYRKQQLAL